MEPQLLLAITLLVLAAFRELSVVRKKVHAVIGKKATKYFLTPVEITLRLTIVYGLRSPASIAAFLRWPPSAVGDASSVVVFEQASAVFAIVNVVFDIITQGASRWFSWSHWPIYLASKAAMVGFTRVAPPSVVCGYASIHALGLIKRLWNLVERGLKETGVLPVKILTSDPARLLWEIYLFVLVLIFLRGADFLPPPQLTDIAFGCLLFNLFQDIKDIARDAMALVKKPMKND